MPELSEPMKARLLLLSSGRDFYHGVRGQSQFGGVGLVRKALYRRGLIDRENNLTAEGSAVAEKLRNGDGRTP